MMIRLRVAAAALCGLCACTTPASHDPPASRAPDTASVMELAAGPDEAPLTLARAVISPTADMLAAALANDPDAMRDAVIATAGSCQASSTCPAQFGACTNWSTPSLCNSTCGASFCLCKPIRECGGDPPEPKGVDTYNSFRVCFDSNQNPCTEWSSTTSTFCGC